MHGYATPNYFEHFAFHCLLDALGNGTTSDNGALRDADQDLHRLSASIVQASRSISSAFNGRSALRVP